MSTYKTRDKLTGYGIDEDTLETLAEIYPFLTSVIDEVLDKFYVDLMGNERTSLILRDEEVRLRARIAQKKHWINFVLSGNYHHKYFEAAERIGKTHWHHGVSLTDFSSAYHRVLGYLTQFLVGKYIDSPTLLLNAMMAIQKVTFMDMDCASSAYRRYDQEQQRRLFLIDQLTGAGNRAAFVEDLVHCLEEYDNNQVPFSIALVDMDNFKAVNDNHGHVVGDRVLKTVAEAIKESLRVGDRVYRYGGDEFTVLLSGTHLSEAKKIMERTLKNVAGKTIPAREGEISTTVSIGVAEQGKDTETAEKLIEKADKALYKSKEGGRNRVSV
ncbi:diguanylate cyclase [Emcibacter sp.]|uniref:diguanylate cyclase n=1 Tax=Emcibacter sp. TaxID=1979954 RepID=UPI002AA6AA9E|nr:diguanylate cyclase [Emcibacter sp.]